MPEYIESRTNAVSILQQMLLCQAYSSPLQRYCFQLAKIDEGFYVIALESMSLNLEYTKPVYRKGFFVNPVEVNIGEKIPSESIALDMDTMMYTWTNQ